MTNQPDFTEEELRLLAELADEALDDSRPSLSSEEVGRTLQRHYELAVRERRRIA